MVAGVTSCPKCRAEILSDDHYCQECGVQLPWLLVDCEPPERDSHVLSAGADCGTTVVSRPVLDLSISVLLLVFFGLLIWWLVDWGKDYSPVSWKESVIQARSSVGTGRLDEAVHIMERLSLIKAGQLSEEERSVLNEALYVRARKHAEKHNYRLALSDLLRISPQFMHYEDTRIKIRTYSSLAQAEMQSTNNEPTSNAVYLTQERGHRSGAGKTPALPPRVTSLDSSKVNGTEPESQGTAHQDQATVGDDIIGEESSPSPRVSDSIPGAPSRWHYTDDDIARYHKLLADYFSVSRLGTARTVKENLGAVAANREPPTLKEWFDSGKPNF